MICTLVATVFQVVTEAQAAPVPVATAPWLDGRPTVMYVTQAPSWRPASDGPIHFVRFEEGFGPRCGLLDGETVLELSSDVFSAPVPTGRVLHRSEVRLLSPLSSEQIGTVAFLEPTTSSEFAAVELRLVDGSPKGPGDCFEVGDSANCIARSVLGLVVGARSRILGVTGATLIRERGAPKWQLALGPSLVQGSEPETTHRLPVHAVASAESLVRARGYRAGDLLLLDPRGSDQELGPGTREWVTHAKGVGELRNEVCVRRAEGEA